MLVSWLFYLQRVELMKLRIFVSAGILALCVLSIAAAQPLHDSSATTETTCNFGMAKHEKSQSCRIPIPSGCVVANFPGTTKPWTNISKGGLTTCRFNDKETDWNHRHMQQVHDPSLLRAICRGVRLFSHASSSHHASA
jgi:hypothetical protein